MKLKPTLDVQLPSVLEDHPKFTSAAHAWANAKAVSDVSIALAKRLPSIQPQVRKGDGAEAKIALKPGRHGLDAKQIEGVAGAEIKTILSGIRKQIPDPLPDGKASRRPMLEQEVLSSPKTWRLLFSNLPIRFHHDLIGKGWSVVGSNVQVELPSKEARSMKAWLKKNNYWSPN